MKYASNAQPFRDLREPVRHSACRIEPSNFGFRVELFLTQHRMRVAKGDHVAGKPEDLLMPFEVAPVKPTGFIVLAVSIVVAALRAPNFIPSEQQRHAARDQQGQKEVLDLPPARGLDSGVLCRARLPPQEIPSPASRLTPRRTRLLKENSRLIRRAIMAAG